MKEYNLYVSPYFEEEYEKIKNDIFDLKFSLQKELTENNLNWDNSQFKEIMEFVKLINKLSEDYPR